MIFLKCKSLNCISTSKKTISDKITSNIHLFIDDHIDLPTLFVPYNWNSQTFNVDFNCLFFY